MALELKKLSIPDVLLVKSNIFADERGYFLEFYRQEEFAAAGLPESFAQDNFSFSRKNVLRGLHYQLEPFAQGKLVRAVEGEIWDVALDIRRNSKTFKQWVGTKLTEDSGEALYIPPGFAHGFVVLSAQAKVLYKTTVSYSKEHERGIVWNDPELNISWPVERPVLSEKDKAYPSLAQAEIGS